MRYSEPPELPEDPVSFQRPPVAEVALAVQLAQPAIDLEVLAEVTRRVRSSFPVREQHPALPPITEDFSVPPRSASFQFEISTEFALPRTWFISEDRTHLLQIQADRIAFNWRRQTPTEQYPRYRPLRDLFAQRLCEIWEVFAAAGKDAPTINFCEVTYVNQIQAPDEQSDGASHPDLGGVIRLAQPWTQEGFLPRPEDTGVQARFRIPSPESQSEPRGRLYVSAAPAYRPDGTPIYAMTLLSRLMPTESDDMTGSWTALDTGREWIVKGFEQLTTEQMHRIWNTA